MASGESICLEDASDSAVVEPVAASWVAGGKERGREGGSKGWREGGREGGREGRKDRGKNIYTYIHTCTCTNKNSVTCI